LDALRDEIEAGTPVVGLEPACVSAFRDELSGLCGNDPRAARLSKNVYTLAEYLAHIGFQPGRLEQHLLVHHHCHQRGVLGIAAEETMLRACGEFDVPTSGCCGMAGSFGFERAKAALSLQIGERELLPGVRAADADTLIVANGFSCREQIRQATGRAPLHLAQVLARGLQTRTRRPPQ